MNFHPFYKSFLKKPSNAKHSNNFKNYARIYTVEVLDSRDPAIQLNIAKPHDENLFKRFIS